MVDKLRNAKLQVLPYVEIIIKPADTRPIRIVQMEPFGDIDFSDGTADDMAEFIGIVGSLRVVATAILNVRLFKEALPAKVEQIIASGDEELPF